MIKKYKASRILDFNSEKGIDIVGGFQGKLGIVALKNADNKIDEIGSETKLTKYPIIMSFGTAEQMDNIIGVLISIRQTLSRSDENEQATTQGNGEESQEGC
jgi:hypothetical protein